MLTLIGNMLSHFSQKVKWLKDLKVPRNAFHERLDWRGAALRRNRLARLWEREALPFEARYTILPSALSVTMRARLSGQREMYSTNRCIPALSPASIRTELSTLNPECLQPRMFAATSGSILQASRSKSKTFPARCPPLGDAICREYARSVQCP